MSFSINGFGTTFYGRRLRGQDGSYIAKKWFILACVPVLPLESARLRVSRRGFSGQEYDVIEDIPLDWIQVLNTYIYVYALIPACLYRFVVKPPEPPSFFPPALGFAYVFWPMVFLVLLPFVFRLFSKQKRRAARRTRS